MPCVMHLRIQTNALLYKFCKKIYRFLWSRRQYGDIGQLVVAYHSLEKEWLHTKILSCDTDKVLVGKVHFVLRIG